MAIVIDASKMIAAKIQDRIPFSVYMDFFICILYILPNYYKIIIIYLLCFFNLFEKINPNKKYTF